MAIRPGITKRHGPFRMKPMNRAVTDPTTGERTFVTTRNKTGRVEWVHSKEWHEDCERAKEKSKKKEAALNVFRRAIDV